MPITLSNNYRHNCFITIYKKPDENSFIPQTNNNCELLKKQPCLLNDTNIGGVYQPEGLSSTVNVRVFDYIKTRRVSFFYSGVLTIELGLKCVIQCPYDTLVGTIVGYKTTPGTNFINLEIKIDTTT